MKNNCLNILFVIESLHCGGAEKSLINLLSNIDFGLYEVDLLLVKRGGEFEKFIPGNVNVYTLNQCSRSNEVFTFVSRVLFYFSRKLNPNRKYHPSQLYWKFFKNKFSPVKKKYDIAIAYNQGFSTYFIASKVNAKKKFSWLNTDYKKAGYSISLDYKYYVKYDKIVCVSIENEAAFKNTLRAFDKDLCTIVIPDIVDPHLIKEMSLQDVTFNKDKNSIVIVTVGRLAKAKGLHLAIGACEILNNQGRIINWYVVGEGPMRKELESAIKEKKLDQSFFLLGYKENPYPYMKKCDIYAQTSLFEGLGLTLIEATLLLKPIVTTNFSTARAIIKNRETGLICGMNPQAIADNINIYIDNTDFKDQIKNNLSKKVNIESKQKTINRIENLILS